MHTKIFLAALSLVVLTAACHKTKTTSTPDPVFPAGMHAKINGEPWTGTYLSYVSDLGGSLANIDFSGYDSTGRTIDFRVNNFKTRGTYTIPQRNDSAFYTTDFNTFNSFVVATSGTISIQAVNDSMIGGTFSFTAGNISVTEGTFYVNYK
jgi:hypothetical protein